MTPVTNKWEHRQWIGDCTSYNEQRLCRSLQYLASRLPKLQGIDDATMHIVSLELDHSSSKYC
jgi:hypothetical protein